MERDSETQYAKKKKKNQLPDVTGNNHHPDLTKFISYVKGVAFASAFFILGWG